MPRYAFALAAASLGLATAFPTTPQIVGGTEADEAEFPATVSVQWDGFGHICGGVLLDATTVLSAAHCTFDSDGSVFDPSEFAIQMGTNNIQNNSGKTVRVSEIVPHPQYDGNATPEHDVSIWKLESSVSESSTVKFASLASSDPADDSAVTVAGWGVLETDGAEPEVLMKIGMQTVNRDECAEDYSDATGGQVVITEQHLCVGGLGGKGTCNGDSGGPIYSGNGTVAGIVSFGLQECAMAGIPSVFADVAANLDWIESNI